MNTIVTSRDDILRTSRELLHQQGWTALHIRDVAAACGVSVGSIYNYFGSKAELTGAVVESVWREIFCPETDTPCGDIQACVVWLYQRMEYAATAYPGFFALHSVGFPAAEKAEGTKLMHRAWQHILDQLCDVLEHDPKIRPGAFQEGFTPSVFADLLFSLLLSALFRKDYDPKPVLEIIRRSLY